MKPNTKDMTQAEIVQELINNSGNILTVRVRDYLTKKGWKTTLSSYYVDVLTNKPRENDLLATRTFTVKTADSRNVNISVAMVIECKYIKKDVIFWFDPINIALAQNSKNTRLQNTNYFGIHTISNPDERVAKLFEDGDSGQKALFTGIDQCLHGLIFLREKLFGNHVFFGKSSISLEYPVLLVNSFHLFHNSEKKQIKDNFLFEVDYSYSKANEMKNEYFLIDVVSEELLDNYIQTIEKDVATLARKIEDLAHSEVSDTFGLSSVFIV